MPLGWLLINPVQATFERTCSESSAPSVPSSAGIEKDLGLFRADKSYEAELQGRRRGRGTFRKVEDGGKIDFVSSLLLFHSFVDLLSVVKL